MTLVDPVCDQRDPRLAGAAEQDAGLGGADRHDPAPAGADQHDAALARAADILTGASSAVLLAHVNPDADALGSALALGLGLAGSGVDVAVSFAEPDAVPRSLSSLPGQHLVVDPDQLPGKPDLVVTLDVGSAGRLGALEGLLDEATRVLVVDHHATNTRFGDDHFVDPSAEATGVLVARLLDALGIELNADIATNLYAGLATDTVSFRHATAGTHELAARLVDAGARPAELLAPITDLHPFGWLEMLASVLRRAVLVPGVAAGADLVHTCVTLADGSGLRQEELDSVIDIVRTTAPGGVTAVAKQTDPGRWQVSLRSSGATDVSVVADALGGGGHSWAAGFSHEGDYPSAIGRILDVLAADPRAMSPTRDLDDAGGLLLVDKPSGPTSHDVVGRVRGLLGSRRVGHAGTLDPMASGLLVLAVGRSTRLLGHLALTDKAYAATVRLGVATVTDDAQGEVTSRVSASGLDRAAVDSAIGALTGEISQMPSAVSAIKVGGRRSYARVRAGEAVELAARPVTVSRFDIVGPVRPGDGVLDIDVVVECSSGTYVRALARDLGSALGVGGHLTALRRTRVGPFRVDSAVDVYAGPVPARGERIPFPAGLADAVAGSVIAAADAARTAFPVRLASPDEAVDLGYGRPLSSGGLPGTYAVLDEAGRTLLALLRDDDGRARPLVVFAAG